MSLVPVMSTGLAQRGSSDGAVFGGREGERNGERGNEEKKSQLVSPEQRERGSIRNSYDWHYKGA